MMEGIYTCYLDLAECRTPNPASREGLEDVIVKLSIDSIESITVS